ncbi:MAG: Holliday junction branch migration protein RuvA [Tissierellia bacterium]|nr:Holliday junction branch migration protein RuvA [Tissierellia bacterium]
MIDFIKGKIHTIGEDFVVLEQNGIGYHITSTSWTLSRLQEGDIAMLYTVMVVREDGIYLFGFAHQDERIMYQLLTTVKGVGPKVAINALSGISVSDFRQAILSDNHKLLQQAPGIGKKTAERIILELRDKISKESFESHIEVSDNLSPKNKEKEEAIEALISLGYTYGEASRALHEIPDHWDVSKQIREGLKILSN